MNDLATDLHVAADGIERATANLRKAYSSAIAAENEFAVIYILQLVQRAAELETDIQQALQAASPAPDAAYG